MLQTTILFGRGLIRRGGVGWYCQLCKGNGGGYAAGYAGVTETSSTASVVYSTSIIQDKEKRMGQQCPL